MAATGAEGIWQYKARWRSTLGTVTLALLFIGLLLLLAAVRSGHPLTWGAMALLCGWLAWLVGKPLFTSAWVVRIGPRGISSHFLKGRTIPWRDVRDLAVETVQGNTVLVLHLAPDAAESLAKTRRWLSGRKPERRIVLNGLRKEEVEQASAAAIATFAERASVHAAAAAQARQQEAQFEASFAQALAHHTRTTWALYGIVGLNVGVWLWNLATGMHPMRPQSADLFAWGANSAWAVVRDGEYWRLLTATFLHGGLLHLAMNMLGLWGAGQLLNRLYGNGQFLLIYLLSALAGSVASLHFGAQVAVSVGASGAVFGVLGALLVAVRRNRAQLPKAMTKQIVTGQGFFLVYALVNGFTRQGIDNAAHVGGLLAGGALAWALATVVSQLDVRARRLRALGAGVAVAMAAAAVVGTTPGPRVDHRTMFAATAPIEQAGLRLKAVGAALQKDLHDFQAGRRTEQQFIDAVEAVHLPAMRRLHTQLRDIPRAEGDPRTALTGDLIAYTALTTEGMELEIRRFRGTAQPADTARGEAIKRELEAAARRMAQWGATAAPKKPD